jgi:hypothetical protein
MNYLWGALILLFGLFIFISALKKSEFVIYRLLVARSKMLWGENVHSFYVVVGVILMGVSALFFLNVF